MTMNTEQLNRLLNRACEIISDLENFADATLQKEIELFFLEVVNSDELDDEMRLCSEASAAANIAADLEAQDWDTFGMDKV